MIQAPSPLEGEGWGEGEGGMRSQLFLAVDRPLSPTRGRGAMLEITFFFPPLHRSVIGTIIHARCAALASSCGDGFQSHFIGI